MVLTKNKACIQSKFLPVICRANVLKVWWQRAAISSAQVNVKETGPVWGAPIISAWMEEEEVEEEEEEEDEKEDDKRKEEKK